VACLAPSCTETLIELGLSDRLVAVSDYCPKPADGRDVPRVGGLLNPNVESILALRPDLVLTVHGADDRTTQSLRRRGVRVEARDPQSLEGILGFVLELGREFGVEGRAQELVGSLRARLAAVRGTVAGRSRRPRVYVEVDWPPCFTIGRRSFVHEALVAAGGENVFADLDERYVQVSQEAIVARRPDVVLLLHPVDRPPAKRPELANLSAVKEGRVIADLDRDSLLRSSPRLVSGIEQLAKRLAED
jgi:iron complex transport system substrate-binding protein